MTQIVPARLLVTASIIAGLLLGAGVCWLALPVDADALIDGAMFGNIRNPHKSMDGPILPGVQSADSPRKPPR